MNPSCGLALVVLTTVLAFLASLESVNSLSLQRTNNLSYKSFTRLVGAAIRSERPLNLHGRTIHLGTSEVKIGTGQTLTVQGPGTITGAGHSLFAIGGNRCSVTLAGLSLQHLRAPGGFVKRESGAAVWARGKSEVTLADCAVSSEQGYGLWLVQRAMLSADNCILEDCGRSGAVLFERAQLNFHNGTIQGAKLHGVCQRGNTLSVIEDSLIIGCGNRGVYAYHNASVKLLRTSVMGTRWAAASAVQVEALRPDDCASLVLDNCRIEDNAGFGVSVAGNVLVDCDLEAGSYGKRVEIDTALSALEQLEARSDVPMPFQVILTAADQ